MSDKVYLGPTGHPGDTGTTTTTELVICEKQDLVNIADSIRSVKGISDQLSIQEMKSNIDSINTGIINALSALVDKGVEVPDEANIDSLAGLIAGMKNKVPGIIAGGKITPVENLKNYRLDTGVRALYDCCFVFWCYGEVPNGSYASAIGYGQSNLNYFHVGRTSAGDKYKHSADIIVYNGNIVELAGMSANYSYGLAAGATYYWIVMDSTFDGFEF
jgi:hypothetical protein